MYKGRFAPSPTGPLHLGSLMAALISYLHAKANHGEWHIRIDDLDKARCKEEHTKDILLLLEKLQFEWDGNIVYQKQRGDLYQDALASLKKKDHTFACNCTRSQLPKGPYPGTCRTKDLTFIDAHSLRVKVDSDVIIFEDEIQGHYEQNLISEIGDFIISRGDGVIAYHLATIVDDADSGFTHIVRGIDLIESTPRQIYLQRLLNLKTPHYSHFPVITNQNGEKLSKQTYAKAVKTNNAERCLYLCLELLGFSPPNELKKANAKDLLDWGIQQWPLCQFEDKEIILQCEVI